MGFKKQQTPPQSYEPQEYRTGSTAPQKSHRGIVALLLVAVIILGGAVSILSIMNIQLFRQLAKNNNETLPFSLFHTEPADTANRLPSNRGENDVFSETKSNFPTDNNTGDSLFPNSAGQNPKQNNVHGICGDPLSAFNQHYYQLPQGLCITKIIPGSCAAAAGLRAGDILVDVNGVAITDFHTLEEFFRHCEPGANLLFTVYRNGKNTVLSYTISPDHP